MSNTHKREKTEISKKRVEYKKTLERLASLDMSNDNEYRPHKKMNNKYYWIDDNDEVLT